MLGGIDQVVTGGFLWTGTQFWQQRPGGCRAEGALAAAGMYHNMVHIWLIYG